MIPKRFSPAPANLPGLHAAIRILPAAFLTTALAAFSAAAQTQMPPKSSSSQAATPAPATGGDTVHVMGFESVKGNAKGTLQLDSGQFSFTESKGKAAIAASSIQLVSSGGANQEVGGVPLAVGKMAVPYGGGRVLSLFTHKKIDTLALEYRDSDGGLHGALFRMPKGQADPVAGQLISAGAPAEKKLPVPGEPGYEPPKKPEPQPAPTAGGSSSPKSKPAPISVAALQLDRIESQEFQIPLEFRVAIYERILSEVPTKKTSPPIFRDGDRRADAVNDLATIHLNVTKFSQGSQTKRQVTTVAGATKITVHLRVNDRSGKELFAQDVSGNVRFFGENLRATLNLARRIAGVIEQNVQAKTASAENR